LDVLTVALPTQAILVQGMICEAGTHRLVPSTQVFLVDSNDNVKTNNTSAFVLPLSGAACSRSTLMATSALLSKSPYVAIAPPQRSTSTSSEVVIWLMWGIKIVILI
jgi:hypothetical protein